MVYFAFAITTNHPNGYHSYPGEVSVFEGKLFHRIASTLEAKWEVRKIRFHTRKPLNAHIRIAYSSIAVDVEEGPDPKQMIPILEEILLSHCPLHDGHKYVLREMTIKDDVAFIVCPIHEPIFMSCYHNEWFAMPVGGQPLVEYNDAASKDCNVLYEYDVNEGLTKAYKGTKYTTSSWVVFQNIDGSFVSNLNGNSQKGVYKGSLSIDEEKSSTDDFLNLIINGYRTLPEILSYALPPTTSLHLRSLLAKRMASRWRAVLRTTPHQPRTIYNHLDKRVTLQALPASTAFHHVKLWLPWAVDTLRAEVTELADALNITPETVSAGASAATEELDEV